MNPPTVLVSMTRKEFQDLIYESPQAATVLLDFLIRMGLATRQSEYKNGGRRDVYLLTEVVRQG
jgi:DNA-binding MarR family transcriptional regulator